MYEGYVHGGITPVLDNLVLCDKGLGVGGNAVIVVTVTVHVVRTRLRVLCMDDSHLIYYTLVTVLYLGDGRRESVCV